MGHREALTMALMASIAANPPMYDPDVTVSTARCSEADALLARYGNNDPEAAARFRAERQKRKAEAFAKRQPKGTP